MATQAPEAPPESPTAQRAALVAVTARMLADLRALWPSISGPNLQGALRYDVLPAVATEYGDAAATLAADWYDTQRDALGVPGRFSALLAPNPPEDLLRAASNWITQDAAADMLARAEGVAQKLVADMSRDTIKLSTTQDPNSRGWARFTEPDACDFCLMLSNRGGVYTSSTVKFGAHDHCHCLAGPVWNENRHEVDKYVRSPRPDHLRERQNALARKWMRDNLGSSGSGERKVVKNTPADSGLKGMTNERLDHLIGITEALPDTPYKRDQLARLRGEKKRRGI